MADFPNPFEDEAEERWPAEFAESQKRLSKLSGEELEAVFEEGTSITQDISQAFTAGENFDSERVMGLIGRHYQWICNFWSPNQSAYISLGQMYISDPRFTEHYENFAPGLAKYMASAMESYALSKL